MRRRQRHPLRGWLPMPVWLRRTIWLAVTLWVAATGVGLEALPIRGQGNAATGQHPDPIDPRWSIDRFTWSGELAADTQVVRVVNEFGDVRTRPAEDGRVDVSAVIQKRTDRADEPDIAIVASPGELLVEVRFPGAAIDPRLLEPGVRSDRRVDVVVFLPLRAQLHARTMDGLLEARGLGADAVLETRNGDVAVITSASVEARTVHGKIAAVFRDTNWTRRARLETLTGDISVELPQRIGVSAQISTRGEITTDYSIEIDRDGLLRTARAEIGSGQQELIILSNKGGVKLLESIE